MPISMKLPIKPEMKEQSDSIIDLEMGEMKEMKEMGEQSDQIIDLEMGEKKNIYYIKYTIDKLTATLEEDPFKNLESKKATDGRNALRYMYEDTLMKISNTNESTSDFKNAWGTMDDICYPNTEN
jgi:hypothetical protein